MKKKLHLCITALLFLTFNFLHAQTKGLIYKPAGNTLGQNVMDPNGDGFTSLDSGGFINNDEGESELEMIALPVVSTEPDGDISTGATGGHTDNVSNAEGNSLYVLVKTENGVDYLVVRFRIGKASTASKGYSLMLDTDGVFGNQYSANNPGFEKEVVLETGSRVVIYDHDAAGTTVSQAYDISNFHQRSVAFSTVNGNPDYFYDFFIPLADLNASNAVRILGATITSAKSGLNGTISDFGGIDDSAFGNNKQLLYDQLIPLFTPVLLNDLRDGFTFPLIKSSAPSITGNLDTNSSTVSGVSQEANGTVITVYKNGTEIGTTTVSRNSWVLTGVSGLQIGDLITATAEATGKSVSDDSITKKVTDVQTCFTPRPILDNSTNGNGSQTISGTWSDGTAIKAGSIEITAYIADTSTTPHGYTQIFQAGNTPLYVDTDGTWTFTTQFRQNFFNSQTYFVKAIKSSCTSDYSNPNILDNKATLTDFPTVVTSPILASTGSTDVTVTNNYTGSATLYLYVNGNLVGTSTSVAAGGSHTFSIPNLIKGDIVEARAIGSATTDRLSNVSNSVTVAASNIQSEAPQISGTYIAGGGQTVSGTSTEEPGTVIRVFSDDGTNVILLGTTTVDAFNNWELVNLTLNSGSILTATAQADGEVESSSSAGITIQASAPAAPTISNTYVVGDISISGTGATGAVTLYIDGSPIGTKAVEGNWSFTVPATEIYRGAVLTATNTVNGIESPLSNSETVTGVVSFCITTQDQAGNPISQIKSGEFFKIVITAIDGSTCPGTTFTGFTGTVALSSSNWIQPSGETANFVNGSLEITNVSLGGSGSPNIEVINTSDPTAVGSTSINITYPAIWEGDVSTDFDNASNWVYNYVPAAGADISFADGTSASNSATAARDCLLDIDRVLGNIDFKGSAYKLDLNGKRLELRNGVTGSNTTDGSFRSNKTGSLEIYGTNAQVNLYFATTDNTLGDFLINKGSGNVSLETPLDVYNLLTLESGTLTTNNQLTLKSISISETAQVNPVYGTINGNVTIERYIPAKRAFRLISSPVTTTGTIRDNWQEGQNNTPGFGTHITGSAEGNNGFDATPSGNPSLFKLNNAMQQWEVVGNTDVNKIDAGVPYRLLVRGDRTIDVTDNKTTPTVTTLRTTGALQTKDFSPTGLNSSNEAFNFIGNPYQRALDLKEFLDGSTGIVKQYYYVWDPTLGDRGAYVSVDVSANTNNNNNSSASKYLQPNQAFFVQNQVAVTGSVQAQFLKRHAAAEQVPNAVFKIENKSEINMLLYSAAAYEKGDTSSDGVRIRFSEQDSNVSNEKDAAKMYNLDENLATSNSGNLHSIERRALPKGDDVIPLFTDQYRQKSYVFAIKVTELLDVETYLHDKYTGEKIKLENNHQTLYPFSVSKENPGSKDSDRFEIVFENKSLSVQTPDGISTLSLYPNPTENGKFWIATNNSSGEQLNVSLINIIGQQIYSSKKEPNSNGILQMYIPGLNSGVYIVKVSDSSGNTFSSKLIYK